MLSYSLCKKKNGTSFIHKLVWPARDLNKSVNNCLLRLAIKRCHILSSRSYSLPYSVRRENALNRVWTMGGTYLPLPPPNKTLLQRSPSTGEDSTVQLTCVRAAAQELSSSCAMRNGETCSAIRPHWTTLRAAIRSVV